MKKQNKTTPTTKKEAEEEVSRKLTLEELSHIQGGQEGGKYAGTLGTGGL